ncbi:MAG: hypothetical protein QOE36_2711 [Gaiellaceae bacterium]|nr:hypothetical protein [Gaiellaceae bacterium]
MKLDALYRARFAYSEEYDVNAPDARGVFIAEGRCEGELTGRLRGMNHPRVRSDGVYLPNFQGVIETDDSARIVFDLRGYGAEREDGRFAVHGSITHSTADERYARLNDIVCVFAAEAFESEVVFEVAGLVWEPPAP